MDGTNQEECFPVGLRAPVVMSPKRFLKQGRMRLRSGRLNIQAWEDGLLCMSRIGRLEDPDLVVLNFLDTAGWEEFLSTMRPGFEKQLKGQKLPEGDLKSFEQHQRMFGSFVGHGLRASNRSRADATGAGEGRKA